MKTLIRARRAVPLHILILALLLCGWDNPNPPPAVSFITVPHERPSRITLTSGRVISVSGDTFTYNLGREIITIEARNPAVRQFLERVRAGRPDARVEALLEPVLKSPFNTSFKTPLFTR